jgi:uncharacterized membrane protein
VHTSLISAAMILGAGLGALADGIVFHQILQLHNMLSARLPRTSLVNAEINMFWDGVFHACAWLTTALGVAMLWRATAQPRGRHAERVLAGGLLLGWGLFNVIEGVIDHALLELHHVFENGDHLTWDMAFLAWGAAMIGLGTALIRTPPPIAANKGG